MECLEFIRKKHRLFSSFPAMQKSRYKVGIKAWGIVFSGKEGKIDKN